MNKLVATLATTTALFAGSTLYFWQKLQERTAVDAAANPSTTAAPAAGMPVVAASAIPSAPPRPGAAPAAAAIAAATPGAAATGPASGGGDVSREMMTPYAKDFLRQYDNPTQRASLVKAARAGIEAQYSRLKGKLKLDANTFNQLVDVIAAEQVEMQANYFRCFLEPDCDPAKMNPAPDHSDEYLALLGADKFEDFKNYRNAIPEWQSVVQLRGRLSEANYLNDSNAERLINELSAERQRYTSESSQAGAKLRGWGNGTGTLWYSGDGGAEEQLASAMQYSERMRQRAATVLDADQLRAFVQLQEELLAGLASTLHMESAKP